ncbi:hypothetical protein CPC16_000917 [Podila verticillata]|nr:hypothetical protein BGZ59_004037 [Podila verticillata]KAF9393861.1 hypothetical protein CPC16_000917 [Podila verticillata]KAI9238315.1 MAG: hypothetical protein BYD32DRAFT_414074 [Podila humilis]KFH73667.1 hypothetical protein MVEG_00881 [Podila verticillata NRRL 6337]
MSSQSLKKSIKLNSPLPKDLAGECKKASKILNAFIDPIAAKGLDNIIPPDILSKAKGLAIFTVIKAGFLFSGRAGAGIVVARLDDGSWSAPSAIGTGGMGFGGQIGAEITDFVIVLNNRAAVKSFSHGGNVTLGGNLSVAAGPIGRTAEAGASATIGSVAAIYSYSKSKGLFAGVSIEGSIIVERKDANEAFYRHPVTASELLSGAIPPPPQADILYRALNAKASGFGAQGSYLHSRSRDSDQYSPMGSPHLDRSASTAASYQNPNFQSTALNRPATSATARNFDNDPAPRYTPSATAYVPDQKLQGRPSSDSNSPFLSSSGHQNQPMANLTGPRIPPKIGAKPDTVTAMYDFAGEQATDLSFKKGDIITVIKKTPSKNDWWTGRCQGREGSFPANYVE